MSARSRRYRDMVAACDAQTTAWLKACAREPSEGMMRDPVVRLALRKVLRRREPSMPVDTCLETAYGTTVRLPFQIRVF